MPEDGNAIGWRGFELNFNDRTTVNIANDAAVLAARDHLVNATAAAARAGHLDTAKMAVQEAALRKADLGGDGPNDVDGNFDEGSDFDFG